MTQTAKTTAAAGAILGLCIVATAIAVSSDSSATVSNLDTAMGNALPEASPSTAVLDAWRDAGLEPGGFAAIETEALDGADCQRGAVSGLEVVLCRYPGVEEARTAPESAKPLIGEATGAVLAAGDMMVIVSDRYDSDPSGKRINKVLTSFRSTVGDQAL